MAGARAGLAAALPSPRRGSRAVDLAAAGAAIALIPLGWVLYVAKLLDLVDRETLGTVANVSLLAAGGLAVLAVVVRLPPAAGALVAGFAVAPVVAWVLGASPLFGAFVYGTAVTLLGWLLVRRRPAAGADFYRGPGGVVLLSLTPALIAFAAFSGLAGWIRVLGTLGALLAAGAWLRFASSGWRLVAGFLAALAFALLVLETLLIYDLYPLLPVALAAGVAFVAAIPYFLALTGGKARP